MGEASDHSMVLVLSLWNDFLANILWLDSNYPTNAPPSTLGVAQDLRRTTIGEPDYLQAKYPTASVQYTRLATGSIRSTHTVKTSDGDDKSGDDHHLKGTLHI